MPADFRFQIADCRFGIIVMNNLNLLDAGYAILAKLRARHLRTLFRVMLGFHPYSIKRPLSFFGTLHWCYLA